MSHIRVRPAPGLFGRLHSHGQSRLQTSVNPDSVTGRGTSRTPQKMPKTRVSIRGLSTLRNGVLNPIAGENRFVGFQTHPNGGRGSDFKISSKTVPVHADPCRSRQRGTNIQVFVLKLFFIIFFFSDKLVLQSLANIHKILHYFELTVCRFYKEP